MHTAQRPWQQTWTLLSEQIKNLECHTSSDQAYKNIPVYLSTVNSHFKKLIFCVLFTRLREYANIRQKDKSEEERST